MTRNSLLFFAVFPSYTAERSIGNAQEGGDVF